MVISASLLATIPIIPVIFPSGKTVPQSPSAGIVTTGL